MHRKLTIALKERGSPFVIKQSAWNNHGGLHEAVELEKLGVIKIKRTEAYLLIEPNTLVGSFVSPRLVLKIEPKSPDLTKFLLLKLGQWRKKAKTYRPQSNGQYEDERSLSSTFEFLLSKLLQEGIPWAYSYIIQQTSRPRGRILFKDTYSRLTSKGINHQVLSKAQVRMTFDLFAPALETMRRIIFSLEVVPPLTQSRIFQLTKIIGDSTATLNESEALEALQALGTLQGRPALISLCQFCINLLQGNAEYRIIKQIGTGVAEFVDMEKLWEHAVKMFLVRQACFSNQSIELHPLRKKHYRLFKDGGPRIDPDIICYQNGIENIVVDAKYSITNKANASDIYQINSYATRLSCEYGILVYISSKDESSFDKIGTLENGSQIFACFLSIDAFDSNAFISTQSISCK